jgi:hypothetical protein
MADPEPLCSPVIAIAQAHDLDSPPAGRAVTVGHLDMVPQAGH